MQKSRQKEGKRRLRRYEDPRKLYSGTFIEKRGKENRAESGFDVYGVFLVLNRIHQNGSIRLGQSLQGPSSLRSYSFPRVAGGYWIDLDISSIHGWFLILVPRFAFRRPYTHISIYPSSRYVVCSLELSIMSKW